MKYTELPVQEYLSELSSNAPVPGGGGTSALTGALAASLGNMVGSLTVGKKKYADVEEDIRRLMKKMTEIRNDLISLIDEDAAVFEPLSKAYGLPKETSEQAEEKERIMEKCLKDAASVPVRILDDASQAILLLEEFAEKGSKLAVSDAGCGASLCRSAMEGAALNVFINTKMMKDRAYAEKLNLHVKNVLEEYTPKAEMVYNSVRERLGG
jgi:formiminotetrahydrofolate cyclodeaminase